MQGFRVTVEINDTHPRFTDYPLLPGDLLVRESDGTWAKEAPGLAVGGFRLTEDQEATLRPVDFGRAGLTYWET